MNQAEFLALTNPVVNDLLIKGSALINQTPRTLLWGYDCDRNSWHVYLDTDGKIVRVSYAYPNKLIAYDSEKYFTLNEQYVPNKRLYTEACDLEFTKLLIERGVYMPWTTFNEERETNLWHGLCADELVNWE